jgi:ABC-type antimicrobial peptide transport system permease subunit
VFVGVGFLVALNGGIRSLRLAAVVATFSTIMFGVIMLAAIVPIRRALRIQPTEALRME